MNDAPAACLYGSHILVSNESLDGWYQWLVCITRQLKERENKKKKRENFFSPNFAAQNLLMDHGPLHRKSFQFFSFMYKHLIFFFYISFKKCKYSLLDGVPCEASFTILVKLLFWKFRTCNGCGQIWDSHPFIFCSWFFHGTTTRNGHARNTRVFRSAVEQVEGGEPICVTIKVPRSQEKKKDHSRNFPSSHTLKMVG